MNEVNDILNEKKNYRSSFAATILFSGVQLYQILIRIIKSKFIALFIGPAGMGIQSLLHSTTDTISAATNLGLKTSSVKTIAEANRDGNKEVIAKTIMALRRLIWITGLAGLAICALLAPLWSQTSFGNNEYIWSFVLVSLIILLDQLNSGELALLQGLQERKKLAKANMIGQTINALVTIPLYYFFGVKAIVAALVLGSLISLIISRYYSRKLKVAKVDMTWRETFTMGREMIQLGFFLSLQFLMSTIVIWIIRNYVSSIGGIDEVGLYTAGTAIVKIYIGLIFSAIATDYFPRLSATKSTEEMSMAVHTQAELTILLLAPLIVAFLVFCKPVIILLYSDKFLPIENMMYWSLGAVLPKAMGWALSYTLLAKAKPSIFFFNELFAIVWELPITLLCYKYWGLTGFGIATVIVYILYLFQVMIVTHKLFELKFQAYLWKLFIILSVPVCVTCIIRLLFSETIGYAVGSIVLLITSIYAIIKLNKKIGFKSLLTSKIGNLKHS